MGRLQKKEEFTRRRNDATSDRRWLRATPRQRQNLLERGDGKGRSRGRTTSSRRRGAA